MVRKESDEQDWQKGILGVVPVLSASGEDRLKELVTGQSLEGGRASPCEEVGVEPTMCPEQSRQEFKVQIRKITHVQNTKKMKQRSYGNRSGCIM